MFCAEDSPKSDPMTATMRVAIFGCTGRTGRRLCFLTASSRSDLTLVAAIARPGHQWSGKTLSEVEPSIPQECKVVVSTTKLLDLPIKPDVVIDFSSPSGTVSCVRQAVDLGIPVVIGTTGLSSSDDLEVKRASLCIPVIRASNFSLGVNLLVQVVKLVAARLTDDFNSEIVEIHHNKKVDAPSGTALVLADAICQSSTRTARDIGMHALRMGSVVGDHTVHFVNEFERIELTHRAQNRDVFASGALKAAQWLVGMPPGLYSMEDVLQINVDKLNKHSIN